MKFDQIVLWLILTLEISELKWRDEYDWMMRGAKSLGTNTLIKPLGWFIDPGSLVTLLF